MAMTPEQYKELVDKVTAGEQVTIDEAKLLIETVRELDAQAVIYQNAVVLCNENVTVIARALSEGIMKRCGRTGKKIERAVSKLAANALTRHEMSLAMYLTGAFAEAGQLLTEDTTGDDLETLPGQETTDEA